MPFNPVAQNVMLDALDETAVQITHIAVHQLTTAPAADGTPGTGTNAGTAASPEATGGTPAYARLAVVWGAAAAGVKSNTGALTFDVPAGTYAFFGLYNAVTGNTNNYRGHIPFGGAAAVKGFFSVDTTLANNQVLSVAHGMSDGDRVIVFNVFAESLPTGLTEGAVYFVVASTANSFKMALTSGGAAVTISAVGGGEGYFQKVVPEVFAAQGQITVAVGALVLDATGI